ncbi:hypothetical protein NKH77_04720 [Streptomyces sp. M19]
MIAGHDHLVGAWAAGVREAGEAADSMGTAEAVLTVGDAPPDVPAAAREGMSWGVTSTGGTGAWSPGCPARARSSSGSATGCWGSRGTPAERYRRFAALVQQAGRGRRG